MATVSLPSSPAPAPAPTGPAAPPSYLHWGLLWGGAMLILFALWLAKIGAEGFSTTQAAVPEPGMFSLIVVWVLGVLGIVIGIWQSREDKVLGPILLLIGAILGTVGYYLWGIRVGGAGGVLFLLGAVQFLISRGQLAAPDPILKARQEKMLGQIMLVSGLLLLGVGIYLVFRVRLAGFGEAVGLCLFALIPLIAGINLAFHTTAECLVKFVQGNTGPVKVVLIALGAAGVLSFGYVSYKLNTAKAPTPAAVDLENPMAAVTPSPIKTNVVDWLPELSTLIFESLLLITCGIWLGTTKPEEQTALALRCLLLILGGVTGFLLASEAFLRTIRWRQDVLLSGLGGWMGSSSWEFWLCAYTCLVGLVFMFGSVQVVRSEVRTNATLRLVFYGYNAVVSGMLLLAFLAILNVVVFAQFPMTFEWTKVGLSSLSPNSTNVLNGLNKSPPVTVYVMMSQNHFYYNDIKTLLNNCQAAAPANKLEVKYIAPETDLAVYIDLVQRFREITPPRSREEEMGQSSLRGRGILMVQGNLPPDTKPEVQPPHDWIPDRKLFGQEFTPQGGQKQLFRGEVEILKSIGFLLKGQKKHKVYILQGDNELDIGKQGNDLRDPWEPLSEMGAFQLVDRLQKDNYEVKGLSFAPPTRTKKNEPERSDIVFVQETGPDKRKEVPDDAWALVVLGASKKMPKETLDALGRFMDNRGGRLLVCLDLVLEKDFKALKKSGIDEFLRKYGVVADDTFVMRFVDRPDQNPLAAEASPPFNSSNVLAQKFFGQVIRMDTVQVVRPEKAGNYKGEVFLEVDKEITRDQRPYWEDKDPRALALDLLLPPNYFIYDPRNPRLQLAATEPIPVAVAVTEEGKPDVPARPRLVVFGDADFVSNRRLFTTRINYSMFVGALEWMAERDTFGLQPKESTTFSLPPNVPIQRMVVVPLFMMCLTIVGLGVGIWLIRRR